MWKKLVKGFIFNIIMNYIGIFMSTLYYFYLGFVNVLKFFCFLKKLKRLILNIYLYNFIYVFIKLDRLVFIMINEFLGKNII